MPFFNGLRNRFKQFAQRNIRPMNAMRNRFGSLRPHRRSNGAQYRTLSGKGVFISPSGNYVTANRVKLTPYQEGNRMIFVSGNKVNGRNYKGLKVYKDGNKYYASNTTQVFWNGNQFLTTNRKKMPNTKTVNGKQVYLVYGNNNNNVMGVMQTNNGTRVYKQANGTLTTTPPTA